MGHLNCLLSCHALLLLVVLSVATAEVPSPKPWPQQFHAHMFQNKSGQLSIIDLWYDWPNGRNFNIIQHQLGTLLYDLEWTNGTSFYYDLEAKTCLVYLFPVGILRPDWLVDNSNYLGVRELDGFKCDVWEKADFITYYEDVETKRPVHWLFSSGMAVHVITFEEGKALPDEKWQAPAYCFVGAGGKQKSKGSVLGYSVVDKLSTQSELHPWRRAMSVESS